MNLKELITQVVNDCQSLCLDFKGDRGVLIDKLDTRIRRELDSRAESILQFTNGKTMLDTLEIRRMVRRGYSQQEIAVEIGSTKGKVAHFMKQTGLKSQTIGSVRSRLKTLENQDGRQ